MSDRKSMFHDNDLDRDLEISDKVIKYSTPKREKKVYLSRSIFREVFLYRFK